MIEVMKKLYEDIKELHWDLICFILKKLFN